MKYAVILITIVAIILLVAASANAYAPPMPICPHGLPYWTGIQWLCP